MKQQQEPPTARADLAAELGYKKLRRKIGNELAQMHLHKKVSMTACVMAVQIAKLATAITVELCRKASASAGATRLDHELAMVGEHVAAVLQELTDIDKVCEAEAPNALMPVARPLLAEPVASKKHFAFISLIHAIADVLQNDAEDRQHCWSSSAEWSTGKFRTPPKVMTDVVHAQRFRDSPASRPATAAELSGPKRCRILLQPWNDDATVRLPSPPHTAPHRPTLPRIAPPRTTPPCIAPHLHQLHAAPIPHPATAGGISHLDHGTTTTQQHRRPG